MRTSRATTTTHACDARDAEPREQPVLVFFYSPTSGPSRRMDGPVSWLYVRERKRLGLRLVDVDGCAEIAERYHVSSVPTLLLVKGQEVVVRLEGKVAGHQIDAAVLPHLTPLGQ